MMLMPNTCSVNGKYTYFLISNTLNITIWQKAVERQKSTFKQTISKRKDFTKAIKQGVFFNQKTPLSYAFVNDSNTDSYKLAF